MVVVVVVVLVEVCVVDVDIVVVVDEVENVVCVDVDCFGEMNQALVKEPWFTKIP